MKFKVDVFPFRISRSLRAEHCQILVKYASNYKIDHSRLHGSLKIITNRYFMFDSLLDVTNESQLHAQLWVSSRQHLLRGDQRKQINFRTNMFWYCYC